MNAFKVAILKQCYDRACGTRHVILLVNRALESHYLRGDHSASFSSKKLSARVLLPTRRGSDGPQTHGSAIKNDPGRPVKTSASSGINGPHIFSVVVVTITCYLHRKEKLSFPSSLFSSGRAIPKTK